MGIFNDQQHVSRQVSVTGDQTEPIFSATGTIKIESVRAMFAANIATHATDFATFSILNFGVASAGTIVVAGPNNFDEATNGGVAISADVPVTMAVSAGMVLTAGEVLAFKWDEETTDVANATIIVDVRYSQVTSPPQA